MAAGAARLCSGRPAPLDQFLNDIQTMAKLVPKDPMMGMADLNQQPGVFRTKQFAQDGKRLAAQVERFMAYGFHENPLARICPAGLRWPRAITNQAHLTGDRPSFQ